MSSSKSNPDSALDSVDPNLSSAFSSTAYAKELEKCIENLPLFNNTPLVYTQPPNPEWKFGMTVEETDKGKKWIEGEKEGWKRVDAEGEDPARFYQLMISGIQPRPIAFVSTVSESGVENLAPYSFFNGVSPYPPLISFSANTFGSGRFKDSAENIKKTKGFTVNIISIPWAEQGNFGCVDPPSDVSEWELTGLTKAESTYVKAPRVKESAFSMECELFHAFEVIHPITQEHTGTVIFGLIKCIHVRNDVLADTKALEESGHRAKVAADPKKLRNIARMGDISYGYITEAFRLPRISWEKDGEGVQEVIELSKKSKDGKEGQVPELRANY